MKKVIIFICVLSVIIPCISLAKGGSFSGGSRSFSSSSRSFSSSSRTTTPTTRTTSTPRVTTPRVTTPKVSTRPSSTTAKVVSPITKTVAGKSYGKTGSVVSGTYAPKFSSGYTAPIGSTVYYRDTSSSFINWLPFYMIMTAQSHRDAAVVEPAKDGQPAKEIVVKEEGLDTMYIINWIVSILLVLGLIVLVVYLVNKKTQSYA